MARQPEAGGGTGPGAAPPWGARRPGLVFRAALRASRAVPQWPVVRQLAFLFRRIARRAAADPVDVTHWGHRLRLLTRGNISESTFLFMPERWDREERRFLARELAPGAVVVDVGANAGGYLWWLLHLFGDDCRALAVEPDPGLRDRLRFNLATNGFDNVEVVGVAVGPEPGRGWLHVHRRNLGQSALLEEGAGAGVPVPVRPLPELVREAGLPRIDALKMDVEGLEAAVLHDFYDRAPEAVWPRLLLVERNPGPDHRALIGRLRELDYAEALATRLNVALRRAGRDGGPRRGGGGTIWTEY